jgi:hypothetical protein
MVSLSGIMRVDPGVSNRPEKIKAISVQTAPDAV